MNILQYFSFKFNEFVEWLFLISFCINFLHIMIFAF